MTLHIFRNVSRRGTIVSAQAVAGPRLRLEVQRPGMDLPVRAELGRQQAEDLYEALGVWLDSLDGESRPPLPPIGMDLHRAGGP